MNGVDAGLSGAHEAWASGPIRNDDRDRGIEMPAGDRVEDRLQVAAPAGDENCEPSIHGAPV